MRSNNIPLDKTTDGSDWRPVIQHRDPGDENDAAPRVDLLWESSKGNAGALSFVVGLRAEWRVDLIQRLVDADIVGETLYLRTREEARVQSMSIFPTSKITHASVAEAVLAR